jgi:hypothetical protein
MFKVLKETQIKVRVSLGTCVGILISKTGLSKDLLGRGCDFDHLPHLHYHLKEIFHIFKQKYHH